MSDTPAPQLNGPADFDPAADLTRIAAFAAAWRSQFRPAEVTYTPRHFLAQLEELERAKGLRLYLVTRPQAPLALAILAPFPPAELVTLLSLCPSDPDAVRPFLLSRHERREMMDGAPAEPAGRGVFAFLVGEPGGLAWLDLEPEGLVLALARWGGLNRLDPDRLIAGCLRLLGRRIQELAPPEPQA
ncbi:MAG: hypothetical protein V1797_13825 [Pseudomonadota bacterium]